MTKTKTKNKKPVIGHLTQEQLGLINLAITIHNCGLSADKIVDTANKLAGVAA